MQYFVVLSFILLVVIWLAFYIPFNISNFKLLAKVRFMPPTLRRCALCSVGWCALILPPQMHAEKDWESTYYGLASSTRAKLEAPDSGCVWLPFNGTATSLPLCTGCAEDCEGVCLPDACWAPIAGSFIMRWLLAGVIIGVVMLLVPVQVYFAGTVGAGAAAAAAAAARQPTCLPAPPARPTVPLRRILCCGLEC